MPEIDPFLRRALILRDLIGVNFGTGYLSRPDSAPATGLAGAAVASRIPGSPSGCASQWAATDPDAFVTWIRRQTDESYPHHSARILMNQLSQASAFEGVLSPLDLIPQGNQLAAASHVVQRWQKIHPEAARAWAEDAGMLEGIIALVGGGEGGEPGEFLKGESQRR